MKYGTLQNGLPGLSSRDIVKSARKFGERVEALSNVDSGEILLNTKGRKTLVSKHGNTYQITQYDERGNAKNRDDITVTEFEKNYRWHI